MSNNKMKINLLEKELDNLLDAITKDSDKNIKNDPRWFQVEKIHSELSVLDPNNRFSGNEQAISEQRQENRELIKDNRGKIKELKEMVYNSSDKQDLLKEMEEYKEDIEYLSAENRDLKERLAKIKTLSTHEKTKKAILEKGPFKGIVSKQEAKANLRNTKNTKNGKDGKDL